MNKANNNLNIMLEQQESPNITKRFVFKKNIYRDLVTMASREYFDSKLKQDDKVSLMLEKIIGSYYERYKKTI